ncbi:Gir2p [Sugiyamaella lignohabitans]|uniref:Gir2p n=1 Tax=Sugiyamaella lignohabitans TaxID=796027 RepID=A0A167E9V8_9ASCO|nr:Gir2p [Sugiyamaella lignohabitans]ANB13820.1 Gir2p [Sugiyamaella lignohabitans]
MDNKEEQEQEIDVLRSIYPDELEILSENKYNIHIKLDTTPTKFLILEVEYPDDYPQVVPVLDVDNSDGSYVNASGEDDEGYDGSDEEEYEDGIDETQGDSIEFTNADLVDLRKVLEENAEENIGLPSIFTLASLLKDQAEELVEKKIKIKEKQREKLIFEQEEKEQAKFRGTPVTPESFKAWRLKFRAELGLDNKEDANKPKHKLTGKEIFEKGLNKDEDEDDDTPAEPDQLASSVENLAV